MIIWLRVVSNAMFLLLGVMPAVIQHIACHALQAITLSLEYVKFAPQLFLNV